MKPITDRFFTAAKRASTAVTGAAVAAGAMYAGPASAQSSENVSIYQYCDAQMAARAAGESEVLVHRTKNPYKEQTVKVELESTVHKDANGGNLKILSELNCFGVVPYCYNKPEGGRAMIPLMGQNMIGMIDGSLGTLNDRDAPSVKAAMETLRKLPGLVDATNASSMSMANHLHDVHGLDVIGAADGKLVYGTEGKKIVQACQAALNLEK